MDEEQKYKVITRTETEHKNYFNGVFPDVTNITNLNIAILMMKRLSHKIKINHFKVRLKEFVISIIKIYIRYEV
jgi:hypothetical protein